MNVKISSVCSFLLFLMFTNISCYLRSDTPLDIYFDDKSCSIRDRNNNQFKSVTISKYDKTGNYKGEFAFRKSLDSLGSSQIFLLSNNKHYQDLSRLRMVFEKGYIYKVEAEILGHIDTLSFSW